MHELSLCESVIELIEEQARQQCFERVKTVRLEIGALAGVEIEAMLFSFDAAARDSLAEGAKLDIIRIAGLAICPVCEKQVEVSARFDVCPDCAHYPLQIVAGEEMRIKELEVQ
ncbi:MAG: hydrogenase maturation nickel metallochaperone HypA [Zetaproteobacteria bacterium CG_4_9_14_3_um_filter_49_83]|nr:MAG: hydrogenase maturation nickel metallochaperone HypA [Zetaproteobacteria bacterium CG1_02_49_23]PIQ34371.1 MAG: hydrogenase maturation nickel metallochaperone HypA [Zetaproteobacteria bacterium CG17_big_fil_post_rev_8_21_14_2_50_50_13]PIV30702.1 MAG: hydrogenase maturation nickel metallochaperone HypA [Zetaproteobacteria bacterium CG02_land_8_20_14_3_00_50_9]PIY57028.1 MAG: hydrogenase maturation nickel metallochaperone HypA [Zetaproteobacteria bacterium CG_4_10_14_0_8_um_filter_49_80]PJ